MKKFLVALLFISLCSTGHCANTKVSDLTQNDSPATTDVVYSPTGATGQKVTIGKLLGSATDLDDDGVISANSVALGTDTTGSYAAGDGEAGNATSGDAALNFFGAGVTAVTDATTCTDIEGNGLTIGTGTLNFDGGSSPSGELGGTWASPTVDGTHSGSAHHTIATVADTTTINMTVTGQEIKGDSLITAGDALTLTLADIDFDGGATPSGELSGSWASPTIASSVVDLDNLAETAKTVQFAYTLDGGGAAITTGEKDTFYFSFPITITTITTWLDQEATMTVGMWKNIYPNTPTSVDYMCAGASPSTIAADHSQDTTLVGWNALINAGDLIKFNVEANDVAERCTITFAGAKQ